ncbi:ABC transporter permease [Pelomonas sp. CA6]|uniref:ABC transporter permease n=1 Tax=Pelomonas sp. CA6 TaxID=2907999 RepID=UPI001F4C014C|nr:ABC transporter permease [Pelomonas sp. CA6]MCH7345243.1 ABC transporter permease [Pelomonas sp. CA6]
MARYLLRRVLVGLLMLLALTLLIFVLLRLTPGDPIDAYINPSQSITAEERALLRAQYGLDQPLPTQYLRWLGQALRGNLGYSLQRYNETVAGLIATRMGPTLLLMGAGLCLAILLGIATGVVSAVRRNGMVDLALSSLAMLGISSPAFLSALVGLYVFSVKLQWMPSGGMLSAGAAFSWGDLLHHLLLPALLLSVGHCALIMRYMRASLLEVLNQDYVRTARAKGVRETWVIVKHALRNAMLPVVTLIGSTVGLAVGGAIFTESVFNWPGMGLLLVGAVEGRDYPVIMGATLVIGACVIAVNLLTDLLYAVIDPRIQVHGGER